MTQATILLADDDSAIRTVLSQALTKANYKVRVTGSAATLLNWVKSSQGDIVITDVMMPDGNGLDLLADIKTRRPKMPVIVMSAKNTILTALKATEAGAFEYLPKPFDLSMLIKTVQAAHQISKTGNDKSGIRKSIAEQKDDLPLVGRSEVMQSLYRSIAKLAQADMPILIAGDAGTGKSLIAKILHDYGKTSEGTFISLAPITLDNHAAFSKAFTDAANGTLLLDGVDDMLPVQQNLLMAHISGMAIDTRNAPRLICSCTPDILGKVKSGTFRTDLYFRLNSAQLALPKLVDHIEDIPELVSHFLDKSAGLAKTITPQAIALLKAMDWPGNVRQLENLVQELSILSNDETLDENDILTHHKETHIPSGIQSEPKSLSQSIHDHLNRYFLMHPDSLPPNGLYNLFLPEMEVPLITLTLNATNGNQIKAAEILGINRNTLRKKIKELDINVTRGKKVM